MSDGINIYPSECDDQNVVTSFAVSKPEPVPPEQWMHDLVDDLMALRDKNYISDCFLESIQRRYAPVAAAHAQEIARLTRPIRTLPHGAIINREYVRLAVEQNFALNSDVVGQLLTDLEAAEAALAAAKEVHAQAITKWAQDSVKLGLRMEATEKAHAQAVLELQQVDATLARRPAITDAPNRYAAIERAFNEAGKVGPLSFKLRAAESALTATKARIEELEKDRNEQHGLFVAADSILDDICDQFNSVKPPTKESLDWLISKTCDERPYAALVDKFHLLEYYSMKRERDAAESALTATKARIEELEKESRYLMWSSHGHEGRYGDDGEMQCCECAAIGGTIDYKRAAFDEVTKTYGLALMHRASKLTSAVSKDEAVWRLCAEVRTWITYCPSVQFEAVRAALAEVEAAGEKAPSE